MYPLVVLGCLCSCTGLPCTRLLSRKDLLSREDLEIFFQEEIFATGVWCTTSKVSNYRFRDTKARRNHLSCLSSCSDKDIRFLPLIPASSSQLLSELDNVFCMPCISALFPTMGSSWVMDVPSVESSCNALFPSPQVVTSSDSAVGLRVGSSSLGVKGLLTSGLWCRELEGCSSAVMGT